MKMIELDENNSISIQMSNDSSSVLNVFPHVYDSLLQSYLIGEMNKGMGDDENPEHPSEINNH